MKRLLLNSKTLTNTLLLFSLFFASSVLGQTNTWNGGTNSNWGTAGNWSLGHIPTAAEDVVIPNSVTNNPISINVAAVCKTFTMNGGTTTATVNFSGTNSMTVSGAVTINAGTGTGDNKILNVAAGSLTCTSITVAATSNTNRNSRITVSSGTVTVTGNIDMNTSNANNAFTFSGSGLLKVGGDMIGGTFTASTSTVQYYGDGTGGTSADQSIAGYTYNNLSTLGSGTKTLSANTPIAANLNIGSGTILDLSTFTANRSTAGGTLTVAGTLQLGGSTGGQTGSNFPTNFSTLTLTGGTVDYNIATGGQTIYNTPTYSILKVSNTTGTQTAGGNLTATTLNTSAGGTLNMATFTLSLTNISNSGTIRTQNTSATPIPAGKAWGGTVQFDGAGQSVPGTSTTFTNLIYGGSGTKTLTGAAISISGDFTINTGVVANLGTFTSTAIALTLGGTAQAAGQYGGTSSGATFINTTFFATATGKLNVTCSTPGLWTGTTSTNWATPSNWCGGVVPTATINVIINSGGNQPVISAAALCKNITLGSGATVTLNSTLDVAGNWTNNGATLSGTGTVTLNGTATIGGSAATTFPNLTTTGTITQGINTNVSGDFSQPAGTYDVSATASSYTLAVTGNFSISGGTFNVSNGANNSVVTVGGTFDISSGSVILINNASSTGATVTVNGDVSVSGTGVLNFELVSAATGVAVFNTNSNVSLTGTGTNYIDFGTGTATNNAFNIKGNFTKSGTGIIYITSTGAVKGFVFNGTGTSGTPQTLSYSGTASVYHDYTVNSGTYVKLLTSLALGTLTNPASTFTIDGTLEAQTFVISGSSTAGVKLNAAATLVTANTGGVTATITATTPTYNAGANYVFNGAANQNTAFSNTTMNNLTIANTGALGSNTVTINTAAPTINGSLAVTNGVLNAAAFQIVGNATNPFTLASGTTFRLSGNYPTLFTGANTTFNAASTVQYYGATQTVSNTPTYGNLTITTAGSKTAGGALTVAGTLTINTGATFDASTFTHSVAGNWVNNSIFTAGTSTLNFNGTTTISGSATNSFNNITIAGTLIGPSAGTMNVAGTWNKTGTFVHNSGTVTLNGTTQSILGSSTTFNNLVLATSASTKTLGVATTINGNLTINTGVIANLSTFKHTAATLTLGGAAQGTGTSYGGIGSPATTINSTFFSNNTGYLNVGTCGSYSLSSIAAAAPACISSTATINVTSTVGNLPDGTYTVFYTLSAPNAGTSTATMTVSGGTGSGSFTTVSLSNTGSTTITINYIRNGCVSTISAGNTAVITVNPNNTVGAASSTPTLCINTALTAITHTTTVATGIGIATGLPTGVTAAWASNTITISGTPTVSGTFNYTIPLSGGCGSVSATGTITVKPNNTAGAASSTPTLCINTALTAITHSTTGATGIGSATGLPTGVTAAWASNTITISGTPTVAGTFNYSIPLAGGCGSVNATGTITVTPANTAGAASSSPTICINTALTAITHTTTGATGIGSATGLPTGVTAAWATNTITISGTPTVAGTFNYSIPLTGGCGTVNATGTIIVDLASVGGSVSAAQTICYGTEPADITVTGYTGSVIKWQSASDAAFTTPNDILFTSDTLDGLTIGALTADTYFRAVVQSGTCASANSVAVLITVDALSVGGTVSADQTICSGTQPAAVTVSGHTGSVIKWETSIDAAFTSPTDIFVTTTTLSGASIGTLTQDTYIRAVVQNGSCGTAESSAVLITVNDPSVGGSIGGSAAVCAGSTSGLLTLSSYTGSILRWEYAVAPFTSWTTIANTTNTYTSGALTQTTQFRAVVQNGSCPSDTSAVATITINTTTWSTGAWSNGTPDATKAAVIADSFVSAGSFNACSLTVNNGASVVISSGDTVNLSGPITILPGCFVVFNNNANLIQSGTTNANTGNLIIKRNSSALKRQDYTIWSTPVSNQQLAAFSPQTLTNRFYTYNTNTNLYDQVATPSATIFNTAQGYLIRMPNNHPTTATIWTGQFVGVPNNGNYSYTLVNGGAGQRFNLVGNPYPSPIDATAFIGDTNNNSTITGTLYFWRKTNNALSPTYCTWNLGGFVSNGEAQVFNPNDVIQTGQGFFVEGTGNGTVNFTNSMRIDNHANQFFKSSNANATATTTIERNRIWLNATNDAGLFSQTMVGYMTNATLGVDSTLDGKYINDGDIALTSLIDTTPYAIQARALPFDPTDIVPMQFKAATAGQYTIAIDHVDGLFTANQEVYLRDNLTGEITNLNTASYSFATETGTFASRFEILYQMPLGYVHPVFTSNQVIVYKNNTDEIVVNAGNVEMNTVKVFDVRGRLLEVKSAINASQTTLKGGTANEVLLVQVTAQDGSTVTKKVIR